jgi:hypothetical protein
MTGNDLRSRCFEQKNEKKDSNVFLKNKKKRKNVCRNVFNVTWFDYFGILQHTLFRNNAFAVFQNLVLDH